MQKHFFLQFTEGAYKQCLSSIINIPIAEILFPAPFSNKKEPKHLRETTTGRPRTSFDASKERDTQKMVGLHQKVLGVNLKELPMPKSETTSIVSYNTVKP